MTLAEEMTKAQSAGMLTALWAKETPDRPAAYDKYGMRTFAQVNARANQIVKLLRSRGVNAGDHIAFVSNNRAEAMEVMAASLRGGYRLIPVNWRLTETEIGYILENSDAKALFVEAEFPEALSAARAQPRLEVKLAFGGGAEGFESYEDTLAGFDGADISDPQQGTTMFYTSGTTGHPKGVFRSKLSVIIGAESNYDRFNDVQLCVCPIYHGAGLTLDTRIPMSYGVPVVFLERWDSEVLLRTIEERKVTHLHLVPIMFQRLLALPKEVRDSYDLSSLKGVLHGAAPCPPDVKRAMIEWLGPIINEYYSGTEGGAGFRTTSEEWLQRPGSVGKRPQGADMKLLDDDGNETPPGVPGTLYFRRQEENPFVYYKDPEKTENAFKGEYYTLGDVGYFDEDDYLFLTGRSADTIISGGVNIYPQEIDNELLKHVAVEDCACIGAPNREWGEEVKAVIVLKPGYPPSEETARSIIDFARGKLGGYKIPRSVDFAEELPRNAAGKIERRKVRAPYWEGRKIQI
ncbi:MAG: AMP-binding protein [Caulobacterales bacterium]